MQVTFAPVVAVAVHLARKAGEVKVRSTEGEGAAAGSVWQRAVRRTLTLDAARLDLPLRGRGEG